MRRVFRSRELKEESVVKGGNWEVCHLPGLSTLWADWQSLMQPNSAQSDRFLTTVSQL